MAKRDKRIQKKKKRQQKIRQAKAHQRSLVEVRNDADFGNQPPDELESNLFELLANESAAWIDEPEFTDISFDPSVSMVAFIHGMEQRGVDANAFFDDIDDEKRNVLMWDVIAEITPMLVVPERITQIIAALTHLEKRWSKDKQKSAEISGLVLVRTMLKEYASDEENTEALAMIGLLQAIAHRSVMQGFEMDDPFAEADGLIEAGDKALFSREIELDLYNPEEVETAANQFVSMRQRESGTSSQPYLLELVEVVRESVRKPDRSAMMSAKIQAYIDEERDEALPVQYASVLKTMIFFLNEGAEDSFDEIERLMTAAMFGEIGKYLEEQHLLEHLTEEDADEEE